jgi:hypothetical protein
MASSLTGAGSIIANIEIKINQVGIMSPVTEGQEELPHK